jgi:hypothetical protein
MNTVHQWVPFILLVQFLVMLAAVFFATRLGDPQWSLRKRRACREAPYPSANSPNRLRY